jgi:hypothetical protein
LLGLPKIHLKPVQLSFQLVSENTSKTRDFRTGIPLCQICVTIFVEEKIILSDLQKRGERKTRANECFDGMEDVLMFDAEFI